MKWRGAKMARKIWSGKKKEGGMGFTLITSNTGQCPKSGITPAFTLENEGFYLILFWLKLFTCKKKKNSVIPGKKSE